MAAVMLLCGKAQWIACRGLSTCLKSSSLPSNGDCFEILPPSLMHKVRERLGVHNPTDIQTKALPHILSGRDVVLNAETGSGKTLCYMLPILNWMYKHQMQTTPIPTPIAAVVVPTPELALQVNSVYKLLGEREWGSSVVFGERNLSLRKDTHVIIGTPGGLKDYLFPRLFRQLEMLVLDEADILLSGGEHKVVWKCLDVFQSVRKEKQGVDVLKRKRKGEEEEESLVTGGYPGALAQQQTGEEEEEEEAVGAESLSHQLVLAAATLPSGGRRTIHSILRARLPRRTFFISTDHTHKTIESIDFVFMPVTDEGNKSAKFIELLQSTLSSDEKSSIAAGGSESRANVDSPPKILVFAATASSVDKAYATLLSSSPKHAWWKDRVAKLHGDVPLSEREVAMEGFRDGSVQVLIASDLASRGLDIPNITAVVHYDFPQNVAVFLHRSGRTGRAGREGKVIAFYLETDKDLMEVIQETITSEEVTFSKLFSRNKMLRRKLNRRARSLKQLVSDTC